MVPLVQDVVTRISEFYRRIASLKRTTPQHQIFVDSILHNPEVMDRWTQFMHTHFGFSRATAYSIFYPSRQDVAHCMTQAYERALMPYMLANISENVTHARKISTYIQHAWTQKWGVYHAVYDRAHLPHDTYADWILMRTLSLALPVYRVYRGTPPPFSARTCSFGCPQPGDIQHLLVQCPYTTVHAVCSRSRVGVVPCDLRALFDTDKYDLHDLVHNATYPVHLVRNTLRTHSALGEAAER